jgi:hypothetical protein
MESAAPIQWTLSAAHAEFGMHRDTIKGRLTRIGEQPSADGYWTTQQICAAVFGDMDGEKLRKMKGEADKIEMENRKTTGELIDVPAVIEVGQRFTFAIRQVIVNSKLSQEDKQAVLNELASIAETDWTKRETYADADPT